MGAGVIAHRYAADVSFYCSSVAADKMVCRILCAHICAHKMHVYMHAHCVRVWGVVVTLTQHIRSMHATKYCAADAPDVYVYVV